MFQMILEDGYDRRKVRNEAAYRMMTAIEARQLKKGDTVYILTSQGDARRAKVCGIRTFVLNINDVEVRIQYGAGWHAEQFTYRADEYGFLRHILVKLLAN